MAKRSSFLRLGPTGFALLALFAGPASAAWPTDPSANVALCTAAYSQLYPKIVSDGAGGAIVTWQDGRTQFGSDVYAQRVLGRGVVDPAWPAGGRAICANGKAADPVIASDGAGGAIIAWSDFRSATSEQDIYAQRVLSGGTVDPAWPANGRALCAADKPQEKPAIVEDGAGGAIVAWADHRTANQYDVYVHHVLASGAVDPAWPADGRALCAATGDQFLPQIVSDGAGGAVIAWEDARVGLDHDIYAHHVLASGAADPAWPVNGRALCTAASVQAVARITSDGAGGAIVTWNDARGGAYHNDIYAQRVRADGTLDPAWPADGRALCLSENALNPAIAGDGAGGAFVAWEDQRNFSASWDVYAQHVLANGAIDSAWPADGRGICNLPNAQMTVSIMSDGSGGAFLSWQDHRNGLMTLGADIYTQRVDSNGDGYPWWPPGGIAVCTANYYQYQPVMAAGGAGSAIIAWWDGRGGDNFYDVYAQGVGPNGQLTMDAPVAAGLDFALEAAGPNPAPANAIRVNFTLATSEPASLDLFDISGRRVAAREVGSLGAGRHSLVLDESRLAAGLYLLRLRQGTAERTVRATILR